MPGEVTLLLEQARSGQPGALDRLFRLVYDELHALARGVMRGQGAGHTLQPSALISEAFLRLAGTEALNTGSRDYFFAAAASAMRQALVDHARRRQAAKRGGDYTRVPLDDVLDQIEHDYAAVLDLDEALQALAELDKRKSQVAHLRIFAGLDNRAIAEELGVSVATVASDLGMARAFLYRRLKGAG
jgi:RNA polymerase sigma factor (TIGR02999 family)